jgi:hypothetical protein
MTRFPTARENGSYGAPGISLYCILPNQRPTFDKAPATSQNYYYIAVT